MVQKENEIRSRYEQAGQGHVLQHIEKLTPTEKDMLLTQLSAIKVENMAALLESALSEQQALSEASGGGANIQPFSDEVGQSSDISMMDKCSALGMEAIRKGEVAALVLSGGQGTRLGFAGPKGMYNIGLPSGRTLFQLLAERIDKLGRLAGGEDASAGAPKLPLYIMTSPVNHKDTVIYFEQSSFFGLPEDSVKFFEQGMLPCLTEDGKFIMESASKVAMAPDGNGGIYPSLVASGMLEDMKKRGIRYVHVFSIDNAMTKPADPGFIGYCISKGADCGNKVVWKSSAHEKVGVIAEKGGKSYVVEYSDITTEMAERVDGDGKLIFGAGNICNHFYTLDFLKNVVVPRMGTMYHVARKKIPYYDDKTEQTVTPTSNNGIKLESFIFDVFPLSSKMAVLEVQREHEFAPVKNAPGSPSDSPDTARTMLSNLAKSWIVKAGGELTGDLDATCEISPSTSYGGEGLENLANQKEIDCPFAL